MKESRLESKRKENNRKLHIKIVNPKFWQKIKATYKEGKEKIKGKNKKYKEEHNDKEEIIGEN